MLPSIPDCTNAVLVSTLKQSPVLASIPRTTIITTITLTFQLTPLLTTVRHRQYIPSSCLKNSVISTSPAQGTELASVPAAADSFPWASAMAPDGKSRSVLLLPTPQPWSAKPPHSDRWLDEEVERCYLCAHPPLGLPHATVKCGSRFDATAMRCTRQVPPPLPTLPNHDGSWLQKSAIPLYSELRCFPIHFCLWCAKSERHFVYFPEVCSSP